MPSVFPYIGYWGYDYGGEIGEEIESYDDGTTRRHRWSTFINKDINLKFEKLSKTERDAIEAFWIARKSGALNDHTFYIYNAEEVSAVDPAGASLVGRHTAYFPDKDYRFTREGRCRWSITLRVKFLD